MSLSEYEFGGMSPQAEGEVDDQPPPKRDYSSRASSNRDEGMRPMAEHTLASDPLLRRKEVERLTGLSRPTIYRQMAAGTFPRPRRIGVQAVAWFASEIDKWKQERPLVGTDE